MQLQTTIRLCTAMSGLRIGNLFDPFLLKSELDEGAGTSCLVEPLLDQAIELDGRNIGLHLVCPVTLNE